jgi:hypothetical protein
MRHVLALLFIVFATTLLAHAGESSASCNAAEQVSDWVNVVIYCKADAEDEALAAQDTVGDLKALHLATAGLRMVTVAVGYRFLSMSDDYRQAWMSARDFFNGAVVNAQSDEIRTRIQNDYALFVRLPSP